MINSFEDIGGYKTHPKEWCKCLNFNKNLNYYISLESEGTENFIVMLFICVKQ